ncbi:DNA polymerase IV [Sphingobacterium sp. SRCM116780]|uniref:DNA polymerase IV n=1 Tax=Sphingobacterium sp. SRCM116780 TaxID=2907623 RepID=UPI001F22F665|nr:DNA polymerase IV [Sphingobacterium sp. SRCM116780]UIR57221.1 DNA polymerase IV [Sphingobacterium sp. SRCM116780]
MDTTINKKRKIIHLDMDAFFASVDQRDFEELRGKPIAVGGTPDGRGVVAAASYEARKYGVKSAMSSIQAIKLCPNLIFTKPRFDVYKEVSDHIREIFSRYTDLIEPLSLDEAFLDVSEDKQRIGSALEIAKRIKSEIKEELNLTVSAGVSVNKFVAKIASDMNKPDGLTFVGPSKILKFMEELPVERFFGVGKVTANKMRSLGIFKGLDLKKQSKEDLVRWFGKSGEFFYQIVRGVDNRAVLPNRIRKSIGIEDTFSEDIGQIEELQSILKDLSIKLYNRLEKGNKKGRTLTLKVKYADFSVLTRSSSLLHYLEDQEEIYQIANSLLSKLELDKKVRLMGISISNFQEDKEERFEGYQLSLFKEF